MALSEDELKVFREHVTKHMKSPNCPFCGNTSWQFGGPLAGQNLIRLP